MVESIKSSLRLRNSAKAIIIENAAVLLCRCVDREGDWYVLPGGGQKPGETLIEAVRRECMEEVGCDVEVGPLRFVREYIGSRHDFPNFAKDEHQIELMFECRLRAGVIARTGPNPDLHQQGVVWMPLSGLRDVRLFPVPLREALTKPLPATAVYLGAVL